ncbi:MAG: glycosyltransferase family 29 protein [Fidelibacterota bacterium]
MILEWEINISSSSILIIGNGQSVLNQELGEKIDRFETVGRINNYSTRGFEKFIGSHTDIWFNGANQQLKKRKELPKTIVVFVPAEILRRKGEAIHQRIENRLGVQRGRYHLISLSEMEKIEEDTGITRPTTGTSAILWASKQFEKVFIHGFDFFIDSKGHYNDRPLTRWLTEKGILKKGEKHNLIHEKQYIELLINSGKIFRLADES